MQDSLCWHWTDIFGPFFAYFLYLPGGLLCIWLLWLLDCIMWDSSAGFHIFAKAVYFKTHFPCHPLKFFLCFFFYFHIRSLTYLPIYLLSLSSLFLFYYNYFLNYIYCFLLFFLYHHPFWHVHHPIFPLDECGEGSYTGTKILRAHQAEISQLILSKTIFLMQIKSTMN